MRVIAGTYRGRRLVTAPGQVVRPTSDRLRETLFNILGSRVRGARFLDICAGSGAVGIEALSRGANLSVFIDASRSACSVIERNLATLGIPRDESIIINRDAVAGLRWLEAHPTPPNASLPEPSAAKPFFDVLFFDPPYSSNLYAEVMKLLGGTSLVDEDSTVVLEHRTKTPPDSDYGDLKCSRTVRQGESSLAFYNRGRELVVGGQERGEEGEITNGQ